MPYLDIKEATRLTGVSFTSIRRLSKKAKGEEKKYIDGKLCLLDTFLYSIYPPLDVVNQGNHLVNHSPKMDNQDNHVVNQPDKLDTQMDKQVRYIEDTNHLKELLEERAEHLNSLRKEISSKENIIQEQAKTINELIERSRESNIIIQSLQDKMAKQLPQATADRPGKGKPKRDIVDWF